MRLAERSQAGGIFSVAELIVEEDLCINLRGRVMHCSACRDVCPAGAIALTADGVSLDQTLCTGCNSCLPSCPAGALRSTAFVAERFLRTLRESAQRHLHCRASEDGGGGVVVPCFGVLDARLLAAARADGVSELRLHGLRHCEGCRHGDARAHIKAVIERLDEWLGEQAPALDLSPGTQEIDRQRDYQDQPHMDRRGFLRLGGAQGMAQAALWLLPGLSEEETADDELPFLQVQEHPQREAAYQQALVARARRVPWLAGGASPFRSRRVADGCSACLSCGERCPTGALRGCASAQARILDFDPALCTDCGLCERICPEQAVIAEPLAPLAALQAGRKTLVFVQQLSCRQCGTPFSPSEPASEFCPLCRNEQELDEAWLDMLSD